MVKRKCKGGKTKGTAVVTLPSIPDVAPSSSLPPPPLHHGKMSQKQGISDLQQDNAALRNKMDAMDDKLSMIVSHLSGLHQEGQKEDSAIEMPMEQHLPADQAPASSQGEDAVLTRSGGNEECKRRRMEQQLVDASGVCSQEPEEVTNSPAIISRAIKDLVGFQDQAEYSSGDVLAPYLILGMTIDSNIKTKIGAKEYVELGTLARKAFLLSSAELHVNYDKANVSQISLSSPKPRFPVNVHEWHRWFTNYAAIYVPKYSSEPHLSSRTY